MYHDVRGKRGQIKERRFEAYMMNENENIPIEENPVIIVNGSPMNRETSDVNESLLNHEKKMSNDCTTNSVPAVVKEKRTFSAIESVFAWLCLLSGYLFCRVFPVSKSPLGGFCFVVFLFGITIVILVLKKYKCKGIPTAVAASAIIISTALIFSANRFLHFLSYVYALAAYCYFVYAVCQNAMEEGFSNFILMDFLKAVFVVPFYAMEHLFRAMFSGKINKSGRFIGKLILGLCIAVIPTGLVIVLLSYDSAFSDLMNRMFHWNFNNIFSHFVSFLFAIPIAMYLYGLFIASQDRICKNIMTKETCSDTAVRMKKIPATTVLAAVAPILFVYAVFFVSQWDYYISGFTGILPEDFSYSGYAREGFFQLCLVAVMNLITILCVILFMRRKENRKSILLKIVSLLYSIFTLILISTALSKLFMYIDYYGLTHKRIYAAWLMGVLAVIFVLIALYQFIPKLKVVAVSTCSVAVLFAVLALANVDARIAEYNVKRYIDGSLSSVDLQELWGLGDSAIPAMVDLAEYLNTEELVDGPGREEMAGDSDQSLRIHLENYLKEAYDRFANEEKSFWAITLPYIKAKNALTGYIPSE